MDRNAIYEALYRRVTDIAGVRTHGRVVKPWTAVPAGDQPAIFVANGTQMPVDNPTPGIATVWTLKANVYLYARGDGTLQAYIDKVNDALRADPTLGGKVKWVRSGPIQADEGGLVEQNVAIMAFDLRAL